MNGIKIAQLIINYRHARRINQTQFGRLLGVSANAVSKWEREICYPDVTLLPDIAKILGVDISELFEK